MPEQLTIAWQGQQYPISAPQLNQLLDHLERVKPELAEAYTFAFLCRMGLDVPEPPNPEGRYYWGAISRNVSIPYPTRADAQKCLDAWAQMEFPRELRLDYRSFTVAWIEKQA